MAESYPKWVENTVGKGEIARYEQFLLFPQCFQKACLPGGGRQTVSLCGNGLNRTIALLPLQQDDTVVGENVSLSHQVGMTLMRTSVLSPTTYKCQK